MTRASGEFAVAHGAQFPAQGLLGDRHPELLKQPLRQIDKTPSYDAMDGGDRAALDHLRDSVARWSLSFEGWPGALRSIRPSEPRPLNHLPSRGRSEHNTADPRGLAPRRTVVDRRKRQKPTRLRSVLRLLCQSAEPRRIEIPAQRYRNRHGEPPSFATLNQSHPDSGIRPKVTISEIWYQLRCRE